MKSVKHGRKVGVQKKILKRGSKAEPLCTHCGQRGHNAASCEGLGQQLLLLLRKKHSAPQLQEFLRGAHAAGHETHCQCGGLLELQNFKHCESRGHGRRFKRCVECRSYFDILSWSHLPIVRLPLPYLMEAMKRYFSGSAPPSSDEVGRQLGINGRNGSALQKLFNTLSTHEATLALESQNETTLTGLPLTSTIGLGLKTHVFSLN